MHALFAELAENEQLGVAVANLRERTRDHSLRIGLGIDINPYWLAAYCYEYLGYPYGPPADFFASMPPRAPPEPIDFSARPGVWKYWWGHEAAMERWESPFLLSIIRKCGDPEKDAGDIMQLERIAAESKIPTIVEIRDRAILVASPGSKISDASGSWGTLGGYLSDLRASKYFGVTAGHAVQSSPVTYQAGMLGNCLHRNAPVVLPVNSYCDPNCGVSCDLDLSLIEVPRSTATISAAGIVQRLNKGTHVTMQGAASGTMGYEIGPVVVDYEVGGYCFERLTQFSTQLSGGYAPVPWKIMTTPPPREGDSGSWLIDGRGEWAGMVVAADTLHGYALDASTLVRTANLRFSLDLDLVRDF